MGAIVARLERLPLLLDFRDPWALCELGRAERSWMEQQKALLDQAFGKLKGFVLTK